MKQLAWESCVLGMASVSVRLAEATQRRQEQDATAAAAETVAAEAVLNKGESGSADDNAQTLPLVPRRGGRWSFQFSEN